MSPEHKPLRDIDDYIAGFPPQVQKALHTIRRTIRQAAPAAEETIKYEMPTFILNGNLIYFAAFKNHIGLYPRPDAGKDEAFKKALAAYAGAKSSVRFPLDQPIPLGLVRKIVQVRVRENKERAAARRKKK